MHGLKVRPQPFGNRVKKYLHKAYHTAKDVLGAIDEGVQVAKTVHNIVSPVLVRHNRMSPQTKLNIDARAHDYDNIKQKVQATHNAGKALLKYSGEY